MKSVLLFSLVFVQMVLFGQAYSSKNKKAIKKYELGKHAIRYQRNFDAGIDYYKEAIKADETFAEAYMSLAAAYTLLNKMSSSYDNEIKDCYVKVVSLSKKDQFYVKASFELGKIYFMSTDYEKAYKLFTSVHDNGGVNEKSFIYFLKSSKFAKEAIHNKVVFEPQKMSSETINRYPHNSRPTLTADSEVMVYSVRSEIGRVDENIVWSKKDSGRWQVSSSISSLINTPANEGMPTISGDGKTLVFTSCDNRSDCDLYISKFTDGKWGEPENLKRLNSNSWDSEASLSVDGKKIVFSSNRKGGYGGFDLYISSLNELGIWSIPKNLGPIVNTNSNEVTPFLHASGERIYFASQGHPGFGGYDLFYTNRVKVGWGEVTNLGTPINTVANEGSLFVTTDTKKGYFEQYTKDHNRAFSIIYEFDVPKEILPQNKSVYLTGVVTDAESKEKLNSSLIVLDLESRDTIGRFETDTINGRYTMVLTEGREYVLWAKSAKHLFFSESFKLKEGHIEEHQMNIGLFPIKGEGEKIQVKNIFFNTGSYELLSKSFVELDLLVRYLINESKISIEIGGHTDNVGGVNENSVLSQRRADEVVNYLVSKGVSKDRLIAKGYGELKPKSTNETKQGRAANRRIEFKVLKIEE